jgi:hypothetical protein
MSIQTASTTADGQVPARKPNTLDSPQPSANAKMNKRYRRSSAYTTRQCSPRTVRGSSPRVRSRTALRDYGVPVPGRVDVARLQDRQPPGGKRTRSEAAEARPEPLATGEDGHCPSVSVVGYDLTPVRDMQCHGLRAVRARRHRERGVMDARPGQRLSLVLREKQRGKEPAGTFVRRPSRRPEQLFSPHVPTGTQSPHRRRGVRVARTRAFAADLGLSYSATCFRRTADP